LTKPYHDLLIKTFAEQKITLLKGKLFTTKKQLDTRLLTNQLD